MIKKYQHTPVLLDEAIKGLNLQSDGVYLDGTFGCGGHSRLILSQLGKRGRLFAIDRDPVAIEIAKSTIKDTRFTIIHGLLSSLTKYINEYNLLGRINGILLDLGISSLQLDDPQRGFSFMHNGPLDMRMDTTCGHSAAEWLKKASIEEITWVLKTFGEERFAKQIAKAIVKQNKYRPIMYTRELAMLISSVNSFRKKRKHPATRSFQAIRIYINSELEEIEQALKNALAVLASGGRLSVISFHSLEDRLVKRFIYKYSRDPQIPTSLPLTSIQLAKLHPYCSRLQVLGKLQPTTKEVNDNPRARSAVLRIVEKLAV